MTKQRTAGVPRYPVDAVERDAKRGRHPAVTQTARIEWSGVRAHLPGPDGPLKPTQFFPAPVRPHRRESGTAQVRAGSVLVLISLCIALVIGARTYFIPWQQQTENQAFLTDLSRFGPTPTPLGAQATIIAQRAAAPSPAGSSADSASPGLAAIAVATAAPNQAHDAPPPISPLVVTPRKAPAVSQPAATHLTIPAIGVDATIVEVNEAPAIVDGQRVGIWDVPTDAVGHHHTSANPGEDENVVLSAHDDIEGSIFRDLARLNKGDTILVQAGDRTVRYHVETMLALQEIGVPLSQRLENAAYIGTTGDARLTLITCWPAGINDHRLIVIARPDP